MIEFRYRPDIDGLRAVAVMLVLLFHAGLGFSGGFVGVDAFFVISGFLITGLILKEQQGGEFSLAHFWMRRIHRIIPASTVMVVAVLITGFLVQLPSDYGELSKSIFAQQLMLANIYFWRTTGYFDGPADLKPLLHTWSLAVEEQFYLGYPFLLMLLQRMGRKATFATLAIMALGSLAMSAYGVQYHPSAAFFLLPTRAWELLIGALICLLPPPRAIASWLLEAASWLSIAAILGTGWFYSSTTPFPGLYALLPCAATATLIYCNSLRLSFPGAVLASRPFVFVGLLSYSLYLWHWPVLAFYRYWRGVELPIAAGVVLSLVSFGLAYLSWKLVETPFRTSGAAAFPRRILWRAGIASLGLVILSSLAVLTDGAKFRLPEEVAKFDVTNEGRVLAEFDSDLQDARAGHLPYIGFVDADASIVDFIIWGDSHARMIAKTCDRLARERQMTGLVASRSGSPPILAHGDEIQQEWSRRILAIVASTGCRSVLLVSRWQGCLGDDTSGRMARALCRTVAALMAEGVEVWVLGQVPTQDKNPNPEVARCVLFRQGLPRGVALSDYRHANRRVRSVFDAIGDLKGRVISVEGGCFDTEGFSLLADEEGSYYWDDDHLSSHGVEVLLAPLLATYLDSVPAGRE